ncbi:hypothetical protein FDI69_gp004 [Rhodococcus phage Trina]|uniref:Uncharacterized protein n=1 Tax=Rhodococcus phage Trina TaxID=2027905 RepID=A0A2D1AE28_9CAUD|nr:hypothetical protein FDI69_gp004 [Rhodococcus phage Trina]ASZ75064.1 hypothetical protein SEA_TRINA_4 [Rhodococcus phage Trina]
MSEHGAIAVLLGLVHIEKVIALLIAIIIIASVI